VQEYLPFDPERAEELTGGGEKRENGEDVLWRSVPS